MKKILMTSIVVLVFAFLASFLLMACRHEQKLELTGRSGPGLIDKNWTPSPTPTPTPTPTPIPNRELEDALLESVSPDLPAPTTIPKVEWVLECTEEVIRLPAELVKAKSKGGFIATLVNGKKLEFDKNLMGVGEAAKKSCKLHRAGDLIIFPPVTTFEGDPPPEGEFRYPEK